jgi:Ca2+-binding EF-hand superfamily protein
MDTDRSGRVSFSQFRRAVRDAGCHVPKDDALRIFGMYDRDQDGTIAYREFLDLLGVRHGETSARIKAAGGDAAALAPPRRSHLAGSVGDAERAAMAEIMRAINNEHHKLREVFETLDTSGAHTVSWKEFKDGIRSLGAQVSKADVLRLFSRYDRDHHGRIRYSEFVRMVSEGGLGGEIDRDYESHLPKPSRSEALIRERDDKIAREFASTGGSSAAASELLTDFLATSDDNPLSASSNPAHYARQRDMTRLERMHVSAVHKFYTHATQMRDMFLELDTGRSGRVTHAEMSRGLRGLGLKVTEGEVAEMAGPYEDRFSDQVSIFLMF